MANALITGASVGLGREFAKLCARDGHDVILVARSGERLQELADEIQRETGRSATVLTKDLSKKAAPGELFEQIRESGVVVDVLINNAGFGLTGKLWELGEAEVMEMVQVNIATLTHLCRLFLPGMVERKRGRILNLSSTAAFQPGPLMAVYFASKSYVLSFSEAIHNEAKDHGVTVTTLCPGPTHTEFAERAGLKPFSTGAMKAEVVAQIGYSAMKAGKPMAIAGRMNALLAFLTRFAPIAFTTAMARKFGES